MGLNLIFLIVIGLSFLSGYKKGIVHMIFFFVGILLGILAALKLSFLTSELLQGFFDSPQTWIPLASLGVNFILAIWITNIIATSITKLLKLVFANVFNKLLGGGVAALTAFVVLSIGFWYVDNLNFLPKQWFTNSSIYEVGSNFAPIFIETLSSMTPFFGQLFEQLKTLFEDFGQKGAEVLE